jgi:hypothetical protein
MPGKNSSLGKFFNPRMIGIIVGGGAFLVFVILFLSTWADYHNSQEYRREIEERGFDIQDLNRYKRLLSVKQQELDALRNRIRVNFRQSELFARIIEIAERSGIAPNDLSLAQQGTRKREDYEEMQLEVRLFGSFRSLGAFLARIEQDAPGEEFEFLVRVGRVDIATRKRTGAELSARLYLTVYRKGG